MASTLYESVRDSVQFDEQIPSKHNRFLQYCSRPNRLVFQISIHTADPEKPEEKRHLLVMKGAPERILEACSTMFLNGVERELTFELRRAFENAYETMGGMGERVLGKSPFYCYCFFASHRYLF